MKNEINASKYIMEIAEDITAAAAEGESKMDLRARNERRKKVAAGTSREIAQKDRNGVLEAHRRPSI